LFVLGFFLFQFVYSSFKCSYHSSFFLYFSPIISFHYQCQSCHCQLFFHFIVIHFVSLTIVNQ
jgi:hypothetical protein